MEALVTGASGFLGGRLAHRLAGVAILVVSLGSCASTRGWSDERIDHYSAICQRAIASRAIDVRQMHSYNVGQRTHLAAAAGPVVVYGATWCPVCDIAVSYMKRRNIAFVEKDVERDPSTEAARQSTLEDAGLDTADGLPVIDARGTVMRGFYPCILEAAWAAH